MILTMGDDDTNIENEIVGILENNGVIRRRDLIQWLIENHPNERGYTLPTLNRKIGQLVKSEKISIVKKLDFQMFGIVEDDENASYLISQSILEKKHHFEKVVNVIPKGTRESVYAALNEILLYSPRYLLTPVQLDHIVSTLKFDEAVVSLALQILYDSIILKRISPSNLKALSINLKEVLLKLREIPEYRPQIRQTIHILGYFQDDFVIEQLKFDAPRFDNGNIQIDDYIDGIMIPILEKNRSKLYNLERTFSSGGDDQASKNIHEIRDRVLNPEKYGIYTKRSK